MIGVLGFDSRRGLGIFLFTTASRMALGPTQPPIQWEPGALSLGVKRPGREADHSPPSSTEVKERVELYLHSPGTHSWRGAQLKHRDNFTFAFYPLLLCSSSHRSKNKTHWNLSVISYMGTKYVSLFSLHPITLFTSKPVSKFAFYLYLLDPIQT
jgi:hypothetical protein